MGCVFAQLPDYHVQLFDESYGMKSDMEHVVKDNKGFIWLASNEAVYRFDGRTMKEFPFPEFISTLICDEHGRIWMNSRKNIYQFKNDRLGFVRMAMDSSENQSLGKLFQLPGKEIAVQSSTGFYEWNDATQTFQKMKLSALAIPTKMVTTIFSNFNNTLFFASGDSMYAIDVVKRTRLTMPRINDRGFISAISDHDLFITSRGDSTSWFDFSTKKVTTIDFKNEIPGANNDFLYIRSVLNIDSQRVFLATHAGLLELNLTTRKFRRLKLYHKGYPLDPTPNYFDLFLDKDKKVWAILGIGLISFSPDRETVGLIRDREANGEYTWPNNVRNFSEDEKGNLWMATSEGFAYWNLRNNEITMHPAVPGATDRLYIPSVRGLFYDGRYLILGTSSSGAWIYDPKTDHYSRPEYHGDDTLRRKFELDFIRQIIQLPDSNYLIVANQCYILQKDNFRLREFDMVHQKSSRPNLAYIDANKNIWLGKDGGIVCYDSSLNYKNDWKWNQSIMSMHELRNGKWLMGTLNGLYKVTIHSDMLDILKDSLFAGITHVDFIEVDHHGKYWIGCNEGLIRYDPVLSNLEVFDYYDNVQGNRFMAHPLFNKDGVLFIGGINGINYFHPEKIKVKKDSLLVSLMKVTVNQDDTSYYNITGPLSLKYNQNSIDIEFIAPYYGNSNRLQYRYQLGGLESTWKNNGNNNKVSFTSLPPGEYKFKAAASVDGIHWYESSDSLSFNIAYPFWQTWWFILCFILGGSGLLYYFFRNRIKVIREKERTKRDYERKIAEVEMHALRAQMNPHFMFNSLNSINNFILKNDPDNASGYLTKFSRLMRLILDNSRSEWVMLENELKALELYIQLEVVRFDHVFDYTIEVSPEIDMTGTWIPPMILQPYVENAIWHGLLHRKSPGGKLMIRLWREQAKLHVSIEDNGVGREEAKRLNSKSATKHKSHGMKITAERIEIVNRVYHVNATVAIDDLPASDGTVGGTKVSLTLHDKMYDSHNRG
jgi:ligand-binding sensor domain-containing protein